MSSLTKGREDNTERSVLSSRPFMLKTCRREEWL